MNAISACQYAKVGHATHVDVESTQNALPSLFRVLTDLNSLGFEINRDADMTDWAFWRLLFSSSRLEVLPNAVAIKDMLALSSNGIFGLEISCQRFSKLTVSLQRRQTTSSACCSMYFAVFDLRTRSG